MIKNKQGIHILILVSFLLCGAVFGMKYLGQEKSAEPEPSKKTVALKSAANEVVTLTNTHAIVYKSPTCGCCGGHAEAMAAAGIEVEITEMNQGELLALKEDKMIPGNMWSCHTTIISEGERDYIVEGHIPIAVIDKLVKEKPDIRGIALPGMPSGTPGMPGPKTEPYNVMTIEDGDGNEPQLYISI